ncbi:DUF2180 family protein [Streptomyces sp. NBC_00696]|uniref:DUF2180 family protein n=1 Tax=Streptomyces sp. NBC_00696 TaxID=2903672 RepID=UPI003FA6F3E0
MHCVECHAQGPQAPAAGVCRSCGAAVSAEHAQLTSEEEWRGPLTDEPQTSVSRAVLCPACAARTVAV